MGEEVVEVVCAVIADANGRLLLCQRPTGKPQGGMWEFPGGKVEQRESPESALKREIEEELGCQVLTAEALTPVLFRYPNNVIRLSPFHCQLVDGATLEKREHQALKWVELGAINVAELAPADVPIVEELRLSN